MGGRLVVYTIGVDITEISRIKKSSVRDSFMKRVFSNEETALFLSKSDPYPSMAGNWAAKEAFSKAIGTGIRGFALNEVAILRDELGCPYIKLTGNALKLAEEKNLGFSVSISHTDSLAEAVVIAYRKE